jgi:ribonuclease T2
MDKVSNQHRGRQLEHDPCLRKWKFPKWGNMAGMTLCRRLIAASLMLAWSGAHAQGSHGDRPEDFDHYVLALSIAPSFCALGGNTEGKHECAAASDQEFRKTPLTVHGLWPNRMRKSANAQPHDCSTEKVFSPLSGELGVQLRRYMPGVADGLDRYQWSKHGVCSGLSPAAYFGNIVLLAKQANATIGAVILERGWVGRTVRIADLLAAVADRNPALAQAMVVNCRFARKQRGGPERTLAYIDEIEVVLSKDLSNDPERDGWLGSFVPVAAVGLRSNSGCPNGTGFLPGGYGNKEAG